jgi:hypothetical protein
VFRLLRLTGTAVLSLPAIAALAGAAARLRSGSITLSALHGPIRSGFAEASHAAWLIVVGCGAAVSRSCCLAWP